MAPKVNPNFKQEYVNPNSKLNPIPMWDSRYTYDTSVRPGIGGLLDVPGAIAGGLGNAMFGDKNGYQYVPTKDYQNHMFTNQVASNMKDNLEPKIVISNDPGNRPMFGSATSPSTGDRFSKADYSGNPPLVGRIHVDSTGKQIIPNSYDPTTGKRVAPPPANKPTPALAPAPAKAAAPTPKKEVKAATPPPALPTNAGYGMYADGTPIEQLTSNEDLRLMAGDSKGVLNMFDGGKSRLTLSYTPEQQKGIEEAKQSIGALPVGGGTQYYGNAPYAAPDMSPGGQGAWAQNQGALDRINSIYEGMPREVRDQYTNAGAYSKAEHILDRQRKSDVEQGTLDLSRTKAPSEIAYHSALGTKALSDVDLAQRGFPVEQEAKAAQASSQRADANYKNTTALPTANSLNATARLHGVQADVLPAHTNTEWVKALTEARVKAATNPAVKSILSSWEEDAKSISFDPDAAARGNAKAKHMLKMGLIDSPLPPL